MVEWCPYVEWNDGELNDIGRLPFCAMQDKPVTEHRVNKQARLAKEGGYFSPGAG
jgi:hypothetical protein